MALIRKMSLFDRPTCPECGSENTSTGRLVKLAAGFGVGVILSVICYLLGFIYPMGRLMIPFLFIFGIIMSITPCLGKYCCLSCDAYWNPENPKVVWRPRPPGI